MNSKINEANLDILRDVENSPRLTNYIIRNKTSEIKKTAVIIALVACIATFIVGFMAGLNIFSISQPKNIVEVQVKQ